MRGGARGAALASGAPTPRPRCQCSADPLSPLPATVSTITGPVVNASWATYAYVTQETRLWAGAGVWE